MTSPTTRKLAATVARIDRNRRHLLREMWRADSGKTPPYTPVERTEAEATLAACTANLSALKLSLFVAQKAAA
jgi:hypothetical protein